MPVFALVDANSFYVSCERLREPNLQKRPVVVLSSNDGCIIARSAEVKAMKLPMGEPYFKIRHILKQNGVVCRSADFAYYARVSARIMEVLGKMTPRLEYYSIDEAFMDLNHVPLSLLDDYGRDIQEAVREQVGIPVAVGIAGTKTLAKLASELAKKSTKANGVLNLYQSPHLDTALHRIPLRDVWGVGRRLTEKLQRQGIDTALKLRDVDERWILKRFSVTLLRTVLELRGIRCLDVEVSPPTPRNVMCSRSFGRLIESRQELENAVATFAARAGEKLRARQCVARHLGIHFRTSRYIDEKEQMSRYAETLLPMPTCHTQDLIRPAVELAGQMFSPGYRYYKAAVILGDLGPASVRQMNLFETRNLDKLDVISTVLDRVNLRHGGHTLQFAAEGLEKPWWPKSEFLGGESDQDPWDMGLYAANLQPRFLP